jgi:putative transposase
MAAGRASCQIVTESLGFCHRAKELRVNAYVITPTHLHMIVFGAEWESERLRRTLADLRKFTCRQSAS